jgi:hypothetical protein
VRLERAAVPALLDALERPRLSGRADQVLREITAGRGPADAEGWRAWWRDHQREALPKEQGRLGRVLSVLVQVLLAVLAVIFGQRMLARRATQRRLSLKG